VFGISKKMTAAAESGQRRLLFNSRKKETGCSGSAGDRGFAAEQVGSEV
jgi:hypothetical protein